MSCFEDITGGVVDVNNNIMSMDKNLEIQMERLNTNFEKLVKLGSDAVTEVKPTLDEGMTTFNQLAEKVEDALGEVSKLENLLAEIKIMRETFEGFEEVVLNLDTLGKEVSEMIDQVTDSDTFNTMFGEKTNMPPSEEKSVDAIDTIQNIYDTTLENLESLEGQDAINLIDKAIANIDKLLYSLDEATKKEVAKELEKLEQKKQKISTESQKKTNTKENDKKGVQDRNKLIQQLKELEQKQQK